MSDLNDKLPSADQLKLEQHTTYELVRCLGEGGMGSVFEAIQHGANGFTKQVVIKFIRSSVAERSEFLQNFVGEAKLVAQLIHANIVQTYQLGQLRNAPFIVMEYINGTDLQQLLHIHAARELAIPIPLAVFISSRICRGLAYAHSRKGPDGKSLGIVHRDISPSNIMISREGDVKITDFGLAKAAKLMMDGEGKYVVGKLRYMSPEQARGDHTDARSDLFSVGILLSELLLGINIFAAAESKEEKERVLELEIPDFSKICPRVDRTLSKILQRTLARDPEDRYPDAGTLLVDLERFIYSKGYGPTMETLAEYMQEHFAAVDFSAPHSGKTSILTKE
jgi:serine/threonine-protein kinase